LVDSSCVQNELASKEILVSFALYDR